MRAEFATAVLAEAQADPRIVFLSGDLGFMAFEELREALGQRFINAGVAEQNMIGVAAGLAAQGLIPVVYSIAPFVTLRPYEQIRNDLCFHKLPVKLVGNGGGYGYGIMGSSHHVLQDIGAMRMLPYMQVYVPLYASDVSTALNQMLASPLPSYLRLNQAIQNPKPDAGFKVWRQLTAGTKAVVISTGPVVADIYRLATTKFLGEIEIWSVGSFPFGELPLDLVAAINRSGSLMTMEEHARAGGLGEAISAVLIGKLSRPIRYKALTALGYPSERYGSQKWHLQESGLAGSPLENTLTEWMSHAG